MLQKPSIPTPPYAPGMSRQSGPWQIGPNRTLSLDQPRLIAILNLTPDSFSDGGRLATVDAALRAARQAIESGASMLDIGGESTRPGASRVDAPSQLARVLPVIKAIRAADPPLADIPISIDTTLEPVARAALDAGATVINDVSGATENPAILTLAAERGAGIILMHRERPPDADRYSTDYDPAAAPVTTDIVPHVSRALSAMLARALRAGIDKAAIVLDPGLGFGKTVAQNIELIVRTPELLSLGCPILSGLSRKSFVGAVSAPAGTTLPPDARLAGTLALSIEHLRTGARLFRVHDVAPHDQALRASWRAASPDT